MMIIIMMMMMVVMLLLLMVIIMIIIIITIIIINLIHIAQFDTNSILTALCIITKYIQTHYMHICILEQSYPYTYTGLHIYMHTPTHVQTCM